MWRLCQNGHRKVVTRSDRRTTEDPCVLGTHAGGRSLPHVLTLTPLTQHAGAGHSRRALPLEMSLQGAPL